MKAKLRDNSAEAVAPNDVWTLDSAYGELATSENRRVLTVVETFFRSVPVLDAKFNCRGKDVVATTARCPTLGS